MCSAWLATVFGEITSRSAISLFESPRASSLRTSTSRGVSPAGPSRRHGRKRLGLAKHAVGEIRLETDALPFAGAEGPALVQDGVRDPEPPEAVHETRPAQ